MKAYELAWKLLKNGPFCEVELYGAIDNKSAEVRDIRYVGKRCVMRDGKYVNVKGITRVAGFGEEVDTYGEVDDEKAVRR